HTLDLVVLAAEWGSGRRRGWLSNLHLGARDPAHGGFVMLGKTFKGLTDALPAWQTRELLARDLGREGHVVHVRPEPVVLIAPHRPPGRSRSPARNPETVLARAKPARRPPARRLVLHVHGPSPVFRSSDFGLQSRGLEREREKTTGLRRRRAIRLGRAMRPLRTSARVQTRFSLTRAPTAMAAIQSTR